MQEITLDPAQRWDNTASQRCSPIDTIAQACQKVGPVTSITIPKSLWAVLLVHHLAGGNRRGPFTPEVLAGLLALRGAGPVRPGWINIVPDTEDSFNSLTVEGALGAVRIKGVLGLPCASAAPPPATP